MGCISTGDARSYRRKPLCNHCIVSASSVAITRGPYQKVIRHWLLCRHSSTVLCCRLKHPVSSPGPGLHTHSAAAHAANHTAAAFSAASQHRPILLVELEDRSHVSAAVAVVWRRPHRHDGRVKHLLETLHNQLVRTRNQGNVVVVVKGLYNVAAKEEPGASRRKSPSLDF